MGEFVKHTACPSCGSSDGLAVYSDNSSHCFVCQKTVPSEEFKEEHNTKNKPKIRKEVMQQETTGKPVKEKETISEEKAQQIKEETSTRCNGYRGLSDNITSYFGVRHSFSEEDGSVIEQYYPCTQNGKLTGYKVREVPKDFKSIGRTGATTECFMQFRFPRGGKYIILTEGEVDALSAYQMLKEYNDKRGSDYEVAVVSATTGAQSARQIANNYAFYDMFEQIIISYDMDEPGQKAIESIVKVLPKAKVKIMQMKHKDANEYLTKGDQKSFISDFYNAKTYVPDGIVASNNLSDKMREELKIPKVPLPPFMHKLQKMMAGGIPLGRIVNMGSASGTGKSTIIDECVYYWIFNSPHMVGIVSLESDSGQYGIKILSRHISNKIELLESEDALELLEREDIKKKEYELFNTEEGSPRFYLVEERNGGVESLKAQIENMIIAIGCKVIILDPLQDVLDSLPGEDQAQFMSWQKGMVKSHKCSFVNVNHVRKSGQGQKANSAGADLHEEDFHGNSAIFKSGACNLLFMRDKEAEDPIERNTTKMKASKIRWTGLTGLAGEYYYDNPTHTMWDKEDWLRENGPKDF